MRKSDDDKIICAIWFLLFVGSQNTKKWDSKFGARIGDYSYDFLSNLVERGTMMLCGYSSENGVSFSANRHVQTVVSLPILSTSEYRDITQKL